MTHTRTPSAPAHSDASPLARPRATTTAHICTIPGKLRHQREAAPLSGARAAPAEPAPPTASPALAPPVDASSPSLMAAPSESEAAFQAAIIQLARLAGWRVYHTHDSRRSAAGFPDLCLVRGGRLLFAELKSARGRLRPEQREWLAALSIVPGVQTALWRPGNWPEIERILTTQQT